MQEFEFELKYQLNSRRAAAVRCLLRARCVPDPKYPENVVASAYYDTLGLDCLQEKLNSDKSKTKVRLRWYERSPGVPAGEESFLEIKRRLGLRRQKTRLPTDLPASRLVDMSLSHPDLRNAIRVLPADSGLVPGRLWPCLVVRYRRHRFVEPLTGSRISLDVEIHTGRVSHRLAAAPRPQPLQLAVLEVKNLDGQLPANLRAIEQLGCRSASFSKYAACFLSTGTTDQLIA